MISAKKPYLKLAHPLSDKVSHRKVGRKSETRTHSPAEHTGTNVTNECAGGSAKKTGVFGLVATLATTAIRGRR